MANAKYPVAKPILHGAGKSNSKVYQKGDTIELSEKAAEPLLASGHIEQPKGKEKAAE